MRSKRKQKLILTLVMALGVASAAALALYALRQNINLFFTPSQIVSHEAPLHRRYRIGGLVKQGSVHYAREGLGVDFLITDTQHDVPVHYQGVLPDLFREGQGVVVLGQMDKSPIFQASQVLAKHDASYMPSEVHLALKQAAPGFAQHQGGRS